MACLSSRFSRSSAFSRSAISVVTLVRSPLSTPDFLIHLCSAFVDHPIFERNRSDRRPTALMLLLIVRPRTHLNALAPQPVEECVAAVEERISSQYLTGILRGHDAQGFAADLTGTVTALGAQAAMLYCVFCNSGSGDKDFFGTFPMLDGQLR